MRGDIAPIFKCHSRESGNLGAVMLDSCFRRNDTIEHVLGP